jgi:6-phosphogluconolactonase
VTRSIEILASPDDVAAAAAEIIVARATVGLRDRGRYSLALSGGSTPERLYRLLAGPTYRERVAWDQIDFFWSDERAVAADDANSNFRLANESFLAPLAIPPARIHRLPGEQVDLDAAARSFEDELERVAGSPPTLDMILLGMGADGHTASLFPGSAALAEGSRSVVPSQGPPPVPRRLTFTLPLINRARCVLFLVTGADKAPAVARVFAPSDPTPLPARLVLPTEGELMWLIDSAADADAEV